LFTYYLITIGLASKKNVLSGVLYYDCLNINGLSKSGGTALIFSNGICGLGGLASSTVVADTTGKQKTLCSKYILN
jgi:hypothetical protein